MAKRKAAKRELIDTGDRITRHAEVLRDVFH